MSNLVFPTLAGIAPELTRVPVWSTRTQRSASGRETRVALYSSPLYEFTINLNFLRAHAYHGEFQALLNLYMQVQGQWDTFLYEDPDDHRAENERIGTGDGTTTNFVLTRTFADYTEVVANADTVTVTTEPTMWNEDGTVTEFSDGDAEMFATWPDLGSFTIAGSVITFATAPALGSPIYWSGHFYYRCRFLSDAVEFQKTSGRRWKVDSLKFVGDLSGKIT